MARCEHPSERIALTHSLWIRRRRRWNWRRHVTIWGSGPLELSQAQLFKTNAQIQYTTARYDYGIRLTQLEYQAGLL